MRKTLITTVLNEEKEIVGFINSVLKQSEKPDEVIIVDGGSTDKTVLSIRYQVLSIKKINIRLFVKKGNRSVGRNEAIKRSTGDVIAITDAGCILDKNWLKNITAPFVSKEVDVVAGYYKGVAKNVFQKCLIPYVLVMPDKVDAKTFLPSARSMAIRKPVWERIGGFPEQLSHNEDYMFARKLKEIKARIVFEKDAIAYWIPRENLKEAFVMFFRFALGDVEAGIFRPKAVLVVLRYLIGFILIISFFVSKLYLILNALYLILLIYILWSIQKNFKYVKDLRAIFILPVLQITSDIAILLGASFGFIKGLWDTQRIL